MKEVTYICDRCKFRTKTCISSDSVTCTFQEIKIQTVVHLEWDERTKIDLCVECRRDLHEKLAPLINDFFKDK